MHGRSFAALSGFARNMRTTPTTGEALLWEELRGKRLGVAFRRQFVIGRFVADFAAPSARLVIEVDGGYHGARDRAPMVGATVSSPSSATAQCA